MFEVNRALPIEAHRGYRRVFRQDRLTLGVMVPIESYAGDRPTMSHHVELAQFAEAAGFDALWVRDVPLRDPGFGDVGQVHDAFAYLGYMAAQTRSIALGTAAIILPLRHPLHTAKAAASIDQLSGGRLVLGVAAGDRPSEFPAFGVDHLERAELFRDNLMVLQRALTESFPAIDSRYGHAEGVDLVPKPVAHGIPLLVTGRAGQTLEWIAGHAHGWLSYPRPAAAQAQVVAEWRRAQRSVRTQADLPFAQSLYIDLLRDPDADAVPMHLGYRLGRRALVRLLKALHAAGVAHVIFNLKYGHRGAGEVMRELATSVLPDLQSPSAFGASPASPVSATEAR
ncbi:LLM class oxidoreductase [Aquabacterium humicola]|uniref:LLM class oxidoreductase n=1 Tax=Aquabacterium humicola TaxID=3237377 RepID=UPI002542F6E9|nr:LLM class oxidoreductase [Rubrivivax pictus]